MPHKPDTDPLEAAKVQARRATPPTTTASAPRGDQGAPEPDLPPEPAGPPAQAALRTTRLRVVARSTVNLGPAGTHVLAPGKILGPEYLALHGARLREQGVALEPVEE